MYRAPVSERLILLKWEGYCMESNTNFVKLTNLKCPSRRTYHVGEWTENLQVLSLLLVGNLNAMPNLQKKMEIYNHSLRTQVEFLNSFSPRCSILGAIS